MGGMDQEAFETRLSRLKESLAEVRRDYDAPVFRFNVGSFLIATAFVGTAIGCIVRWRSSDRGSVIYMIVALVSYVAAVLVILVVGAWYVDRDGPTRSRKVRERRRTTQESIFEEDRDGEGCEDGNRYDHWQDLGV